MISRRGFLRFLGGGVAAAVVAPIVAPTKAFSFLGGIFRPSRRIEVWTELMPGDPIYLTIGDVVKRTRDSTALRAYVEALNRPNTMCDDIPWSESNA